MRLRNAASNLTSPSLHAVPWRRERPWIPWPWHFELRTQMKLMKLMKWVSKLRSVVAPNLIIQKPFDLFVGLGVPDWLVPTSANVSTGFGSPTCILELIRTAPQLRCKIRSKFRRTARNGHAPRNTLWNTLHLSTTFLQSIDTSKRRQCSVNISIANKSRICSMWD